MLLARRRAISWIATLAVLAGGLVVVSHLPGRGGLLGELRWQLGRAGPAGRMNQWSRLTLLANAERPGTSRQVFAALLRDADGRVTAGALLMMADKLGTYGQGDNPSEVEARDLYLVLREWVAELPETSRERWRPAIERCRRALRECGAVDASGAALEVLP